ncbi:MAG: hypothetical protein WC675_05650 [Patescibacteria group bacterium]|jgi:hypothetical protein
MTDQNQNQTDDFFNLIKEEQKVENPFANDEILFRDKSGQLKVLKGGVVLDFDKQKVPQPPSSAQVSPQVAIPVKPVQVKTIEPVEEELISKPLKLDEEVKRIIDKSGIQLETAEADQRFKNIITARLKDIRDQVQTRDMLLSSPLVGGMGFDSQKADSILAIINQEFDDLHSQLRQSVSNEPFSDLKTEAKKLLEEPLVEPPEIVFQPAGAPEASASAQTQPKIAPVMETKTEVVIKEPVEFEPVPERVSISRPLVSRDETKPKIEDVKFQPRLTGPVEEIRSMTLTDFRRLGTTPQEAIEKILAKIELLEEESFTRKVEAIRAWKENEIQQLYLELGDQSMEEKRPIAEIINRRAQENIPTLSQEEVESIIELNQRLRY